MRADPFDYSALRAQIKFQHDKAWDLDRDIDWQGGIDLSRQFLPLDKDAIAFPGASDEQRRVLSQYVGLVINGTIAEMEGVIHKLKDIAWARLLRDFPVNPEMETLGELFFEEEIKHARMFGRFNQLFCKTTGIAPHDLDVVLPKAFGSFFQKATIANARAGGHSFWWLVASAEEVSIEIYRNIHRHTAEMDPLYFQLHKRHLEDESRHRNYAFLMLSLIAREPSTIKRFVHRKTDLLFAQFFSTAWVIAELSKIFEARRLADRHPFFRDLASCLPLIRRMSPWDLARRLFVTAPYISLVLNARNQRYTTLAAESGRVLRFPFPKPRPAAVGDRKWKR